MRDCGRSEFKKGFDSSSLWRAVLMGSPEAASTFQAHRTVTIYRYEKGLPGKGFPDEALLLIRTPRSAAFSH